MKSFAKRLTAGTDLYLGIEEMVEHYGIRAGAILNASGTLSRVELRLGNDGETVVKEGDLQVTGLTGTAALDAILVDVEISDSSGTKHSGALSSGCTVGSHVDLVIGAIETA